MLFLAGSRIFEFSIGAVERRDSDYGETINRHPRECMRFLWGLLVEKKLALQPSKDLE
jgi:hypothetical protein